MRKKLTGFSLLEIVAALVLVAILVAIAVPSYNSYQQKSRRSDAIQTLLSIQLAEEQYRLKNNSYGTLADVWNNETDTEGGFYTLAITNATATSYTITATATGRQADDTTCANIILTYSSGNTTKTPSECWGE